MPTRDYRDIFGGGFLAILGACSALYAVTTLNVGTVAHMGAGMFPAALGCILMALGFAVLLPALFRTGEFPRIDGRSLLMVILSVLAFALMIQPFGIVPAIIVQTALASCADSKLSPLGTVVLASCVAFGAALMFKIGLGIPVAAVNWPW